MPSRFQPKDHRSIKVAFRRPQSRRVLRKCGRAPHKENPIEMEEVLL